MNEPDESDDVGPRVAVENRSHAATAVRWSITLIEPLLTTRQRLEIEAEILDLARRDPSWSSHYFACVLHGVVASLPVKDPWRTVAVATSPGGVPLALWPNGLDFGHRRDSSDVTRPVDELERTGIDPLTLALADGPDPRAPALIAIAFDDWTPVERSMNEIARDEGGETLFECATSAIRWAEHRRRSYRPGVFDTWFEFLSIECANRADDISAGTPPTYTDDELSRDATKERMVLDQVAESHGLFRSTDS